MTDHKVKEVIGKCSLVSKRRCSQIVLKIGIYRDLGAHTNIRRKGMCPPISTYKILNRKRRV